MIVLAIPDLHIPFNHPHALDFLNDLQKEYKPDIVVCLGDEVDMHSVSGWNPDPDGMSPGDETREAKKELQNLFKIFPKVICVESNHTARPWRKAYKNGLPKDFLKTYTELYSAPAMWKWVPNVFIEGVEYFHGELMGQKTALYASIDKKKHSCVFGHVHSHGGVYYNVTHQGKTLFGLNAGCLIDHDAYAFNYAKAYPFGETLGAGIVIDGAAAHFIPLSTKYKETSEHENKISNKYIDSYRISYSSI